MARRVFFSFHYQNDIWRVNQVRNSHVVEGCAAAGFQDASLWEEALRKGDAAIKKLINEGLNGTTVTAVLIGERTWSRPYVDYEIDRSMQRGNGVIGVRIHHLKNQFGLTSLPGNIPARMLMNNIPIYQWTGPLQFGRWVETAYEDAQRARLLKNLLRY